MRAPTGELFRGPRSAMTDDVTRRSDLRSQLRQRASEAVGNARGIDGPLGRASSSRVG